MAKTVHTKKPAYARESEFSIPEHTKNLPNYKISIELVVTDTAPTPDNLTVLTQDVREEVNQFLTQLTAHGLNIITNLTKIVIL